MPPGCGRRGLVQSPQLGPKDAHCRARAAGGATAGPQQPPGPSQRTCSPALTAAPGAARLPPPRRRSTEEGRLGTGRPHTPHPPPSYLLDEQGRLQPRAPPRRPGPEPLPRALHQPRPVPGDPPQSGPTCAQVASSPNEISAHGLVAGGARLLGPGRQQSRELGEGKGGKAGRGEPGGRRVVGTLCCCRAAAIWLRSGPRAASSTSCPRSLNQASSSSQLCRSSARCRVCTSKARLRDSKGHRGARGVTGLGEGVPQQTQTLPLRQEFSFSWMTQQRRQRPWG